ncbi:DNA replication protein DnaD [Paenibacillus sambharensis]|uniref:DNA replication protein DnaD n=1 Tax=Paenibacillus sambharensis TaxID=1803190 RepID=A0A2W1LQ97_9BACL|nr:DnaD domain protein [Paenibacillus sambharensis]PZD93577.1 DNA replication protein DnaD [Paenibacillus sambharensis]
MKDGNRDAFVHGMTAAMSGGGVFVPAVLLRSHRAIGLTDTDTMLLIHIAAFKQAENVEFPTLEQLGERMGLSAKVVGQHVQRLMKEGFLAIDEYIDPVSGIQSETYNWNGWIVKAAEWVTEHPVRGGSTVQESESRERSFAPPAPTPTPDINLFSLFEQEFGRPLSPMELETISGWLDADRYPEELVRFALKEAVFAGKLHFRYIDRILLEWSRNRVTNSEEARAHANRFRSGSNRKS